MAEYPSHPSINRQNHEVTRTSGNYNADLQKLATPRESDNRNGPFEVETDGSATAAEKAE